MRSRFIALSAVVVLVLTTLGCTAQRVQPLATPVFLEGPRASLYPRSNPPAQTLYVFDAFGLDDESKVLLTTAQGLINRDTPRLYLILHKPGATAAEKEDLATKHDQRWLDWLVENAYLNRPRPLTSLQQVLDTFKVRRVVVPDPELPASLNLATMIAAVEGLAVAYPDQVRQYDLEVVHDLAGRWTSNIDAYRWAFEQLWPRMDHSILACLPGKPALCHPRDYLVAKKVFTFWITGSADGDNPYSDPRGERQAIGRLLEQMPVNIPILGYPWAGRDVGIGERDGVRLFSQNGKFLVPTDWKTNLTLWTGLEARRTEFQQRPKRDLQLDPTKVYVAFCLSDGDNLNTWYDYFPAYWESPHRGHIPMGWTMGPSLIDLQAPLLDYYYDTIDQADCIGAAVSGIGYIYPIEFATAFGPQRDRVWHEFLQLTADYMQRLDLPWLWSWRTGARGGPNLADIVDRVPRLEAILDGYGGALAYEESHYLLGDVAVFHAINTWRNDRTLADVVDKVGARRPAFCNMFIQNWNYSYDDIARLVDQMPDDFVVVRPDELADLYRQFRARP